MADASFQSTGADEAWGALRKDLARGDAVIESVGPVLRHLLSNDRHSLFADEVIASMRGMLGDLARQLIQAVLQAKGVASDGKGYPEIAEELSGHFLAHQEILTHLHVLAIEAQLTARLELRLSLPPALSPLLQSLLGANDPDVAATAMAFLTAQTRFYQNQRRMQLPLGELPGDVLHAVLLSLKQLHSTELDDPVHLAEAESHIRHSYDEGRTRLGLVSRLVSAMRGGASVSLSISHAGLAIFLSALAGATGQDRDAIILAMTEAQVTRLALTMRAAGLKQAAIVEQLELLHPDAIPHSLFADLGPEQAAALLMRSLPVARG